MNISTRSRHGVTILEPRGRITIGVGEDQLREAVQHALDERSSGILMSMEHVSFIDSAGIGQLIEARITTENRGASLKLLRLPPKVHDVLQMTQLLTVFEVFDEEDQAVASFATTRGPRRRAKASADGVAVVHSDS